MSEERRQSRNDCRSKVCEDFGTSGSDTETVSLTNPVKEAVRLLTVL